MIMMRTITRAPQPPDAPKIIAWKYKSSSTEKNNSFVLYNSLNIVDLLVKIVLCTSSKAHKNMAFLCHKTLLNY